MKLEVLPEGARYLSYWSSLELPLPEWDLSGDGPAIRTQPFIDDWYRHVDQAEQLAKRISEESRLGRVARDEVKLFEEKTNALLRSMIPDLRPAQAVRRHPFYEWLVAGIEREFEISEPEVELVEQFRRSHALRNLPPTVSTLRADVLHSKRAIHAFALSNKNLGRRADKIGTWIGRHLPTLGVTSESLYANPIFRFTSFNLQFILAGILAVGFCVATIELAKRLSANK